MKQLDLRGLTDAERDTKVNVAIALMQGMEVKLTPKKDCGAWVKPNGGHPEWFVIPSCATSADAVLPLLEKFDSWASEKIPGREHCVTAGDYCGPFAPTFTLAACYAILRANGWEILL